MSSGDNNAHNEKQKALHNLLSVVSGTTDICHVQPIKYSIPDKWLLYVETNVHIEYFIYL